MKTKEIDWSKYYISSKHKMIKHWGFSNYDEMNLAEAMATIAEKNGVSVNDLQHLFPAVLRMLKDNNSDWSK